VTAGVLPVWWDAAADGPTNMAADERLAEEAERRGGLVIRLYSWDQPTVSLGGFQRLDDARGCAAGPGERRGPGHRPGHRPDAVTVTRLRRRLQGVVRGLRRGA
jgi:hypothetical protein